MVDPMESQNPEAEGWENSLDIPVTNLQSSKGLLSEQSCKVVTGIEMEDSLRPLSAFKKNQTVLLKHRCQKLALRNKQKLPFISGAQSYSKSHREVGPVVPSSSHQIESVPPPPQSKTRKRREKKKNTKTDTVPVPPLSTPTSSFQRWHRFHPTGLFSPSQVATASFNTDSGHSLTVKVLYVSVRYSQFSMENVLLFHSIVESDLSGLYHTYLK